MILVFTARFAIDYNFFQEKILAIISAAVLLTNFSNKTIFLLLTAGTILSDPKAGHVHCLTLNSNLKPWPADDRYLFLFF